MKRELLKHFLGGFVIFVLVVLFKGYFSLAFWPFALGIVLGTLAPDIDHLIYVYFLHPQELTSQRVSHMLGKRDLLGVWSLLAITRDERKDLVFHTFLFQVLFAILSFWLVSSSASLFGEGLVIAFSLHLVIDQIIDFQANGNINNWFTGINMGFGSKQQKWVVGGFFLLTLVFALLF